jgi:hypothetical protein
MRSIIGRLKRGGDYFRSGSYNSPEFHEFFDDFKRGFTYQLKKLKAKEISFSKGHFYLSGFFKIDEQYYYFSLSDVRNHFGLNRWGEPELLIRTAKGPEDYTGGANNYVAIKETGMAKDIARTFRIDMPTRTQSKKKDNKTIAQEIIDKGATNIYVGSGKKALYIAWEVDGLLKDENEKSTRISMGKYGRCIAYYKCETDKFSFYYDGTSKRASFDIFDKEVKDDAFIKSLNLKVEKEGEVISNMFIPEQKIFLEPEAVALHDFIKGAEVTRHPHFDRALTIFRKRYPEAYMELLD